MGIKARGRNLKVQMNRRNKNKDREKKKWTVLLHRGLRCRSIEVLCSTKISERGTRRGKARQA